MPSSSRGSTRRLSTRRARYASILATSAEISAIELLRRDATTAPLRSEMLDVVAPEVLTGPSIARIWADALGRDVRYGGDDLAAQEQRLLQCMPGWMVYEFAS